MVTFDQVKAAYAQQVRALIAGGSDLLLVETIFDSLNAKAALVAIREVFDEDGKELPVMISAAVGRGGETMISAQTIEAFWNAVKHVKPLVSGAQLLARSGSYVSVPGGTLGESECCDLVLPERRPAESPFGNRVRSGAARHGPLSGRLRTGRADQHRRRLLRQYARAHRGHRQGTRRPASARKRGTTPAEGAYARQGESASSRERGTVRGVGRDRARRNRSVSRDRSPSPSSPASTS